MKGMLTKDCDVLLIGFEEWENLGLRSIVAFLTKNGIKAKIEPYVPSSKENILKCIRKEKPKIVGFSLIFQRMLFEFADLIAYLRQNKVSCHFTMGGHFPSIESKGVMETIPGLDSIVRVEGEHTLLELFKNIDQPDLWSQIKGLAYRKNGEVILTLPRPLINNIDSLPFPVRSNQVMTHRGIGICTILGSRGCYYNCSFCSIRRFYSESPGPKRRSRSPYNIVQEMKQLFHEKNIRIFIFEDDDFAIKGLKQKKFIKDFVQELKKTELADQIIFRISCRIDDIYKEIIRKMMEVGLISVYTGIESGNNQGLKTYNKHYTVEDIYKKISILQDLKMPFEFGFMILNPDSTFATVKEDIAFLKEIGISGEAIVHFTKMVPYAGTPIASRLKNEGRLVGTLASPDYGYIDSRLELLQLFLTQTFNYRNFDNNGLVERLRHAKFDAIVLNKFLSNKYDTQTYIQTIKDLIRQSNASCLENMSIAVNFMDKQSEEETINNWRFLQHLTQKEKEIESYITSYLDWLMAYYNYR